jgi:anti-sigma factor RsiW
MTCEVWEENINALVDGELKGTEKEKTLIHLEKCPTCQKEKEILLLLKRGAASIEYIPAMPESLGQEIISSLKRKEIPQTRLKHAWPLRLSLVASFGFAAAMALLLFKTQFLHKPSREPSLSWILAAHNEYAMSLPLSQTELALPGSEEIQ